MSDTVHAPHRRFINKYKCTYEAGPPQFSMLNILLASPPFTLESWENIFYVQTTDISKISPKKLRFFCFLRHFFVLSTLPSCWNGDDCHSTCDMCGLWSRIPEASGSRHALCKKGTKQKKISNSTRNLEPRYSQTNPRPLTGITRRVVAENDIDFGILFDH